MCGMRKRNVNDPFEGEDDDDKASLKRSTQSSTMVQWLRGHQNLSWLFSCSGGSRGGGLQLRGERRSSSSGRNCGTPTIFGECAANYFRIWTGGGGGGAEMRLGWKFVQSEMLRHNDVDCWAGDCRQFDWHPIMTDPNQMQCNVFDSN